MLIFWVVVFIASLTLLVKSADWFVESSEKIGLALKISPFIVGVIIVAVGTSFPEVVTSIFATIKGATSMVTANVVGSNIANILLIVGLSAVFAGKLIVTRSLIDLDAPLLATTTALFIFMMMDGVISRWEGALLLLSFVIYLLYTIFQRRTGEDEENIAEEIGEMEKNAVGVLPSRVERRKKTAKPHKITIKTIFFLVLGAVGLAVGADYVVESVIMISKILSVAVSVITITAVAVGTSLPELIVSLQAAKKKKYEIALGNIFGSNVFNVLLVAGAPAVFKPLMVDPMTKLYGLGFLAVATLLFVFSSISRRIHIWEGGMYLVIYVLFIAKVSGLF